MKRMMILFAMVLMASCEVCKECETTYYDNNGVGVQTNTEEVCGSNRDLKEREGEHYINGVKTTTKCR